MNERAITVCTACNRATCWQGVFPCEDAVSAATREATIAELRELALECSSWWDICDNHKVALRKCRCAPPGVAFRNCHCELPDTSARDKQLADNVEASARHDERNKVAHWLDRQASDFEQSPYGTTSETSRIVALMLRNFAQRIRQGDHSQ